MDQGPRPSGAPRRPRQANQSRTSREPNPGIKQITASSLHPHATPDPAEGAVAPVVIDAERAWDRIAELLIELALHYDPSILEPGEPTEL